MEHGGLMAFLYLGAKHMVTGYDHLLFLFGVIFFLYRLRDVGLYVTLFAVGHSVTLLYGVLSGTHVNAYLVDAVIGFSVVYKALDNLGAFRRWFGVQPDTRAAVFVFGLIHGFGLATKLQDFALPRAGLAPKIVAFNAGVEIGQLLALARHPHRDGLLAAHRRLLPPGLRRQRDRDDLRLRADGLSAHRLLRVLARPAMPDTASTVSAARRSPSAARLVRATLLAALVAGGAAGDRGAAGRVRHRPDRHRPRARASTARPAPAAEPACRRVDGDATAPARGAASLFTSPTPYRTDEMSITLAPGEGAEIKAQMAAGERLVYSWTATGDGVDVDMHGESADRPGGDRSYRTGEFQTAATARSRRRWPATTAGSGRT